MNEKRRKSRSLILTIAVSAAVLLYTFLGYLPLRNSTTKLRSELSRKLSYVSQTADVDTLTAQVDAQLAAAQSTIDEWKSHQNQASVASFLRMLSESAESTDVTLQRIMPQQAVEMATLRRYPIDVVVEGDFGGIARFIAAVESRPAGAWIETIEFQTQQDRQLLRCEISLTVFADNPKESGQVAFNANRY